MLMKTLAKISKCREEQENQALLRLMSLKLSKHCMFIISALMCIVIDKLCA